MKYRYMKHTADAKFKAFGRDIDEVFVNSALAMFNILGDTTKVEVKKSKKVKINSKNLEQLMYDFLDLLIFYLDTENFFVGKIKNMKIDNKKFSLSCSIEGDDIKNYDVKSQVKAITYNYMSIKKTKEGYEAVIVVDI